MACGIRSLFHLTMIICTLRKGRVAVVSLTADTDGFVQTDFVRSHEWPDSRHREHPIATLGQLQLCVKLLRQMERRFSRRNPKITRATGDSQLLFKHPRAIEDSKIPPADAKPLRPKLWDVAHKFVLANRRTRFGETGEGPLPPPIQPGLRREIIGR